MPNTNLVFEQISSTDEAINIELPRHELWIPSVGQGVLAPTHSADEEITIRLQVVDMLSYEVYAERTLSVFVIPGNSTPPTVMPAPTHIPPAISLPEIQQFTGSQFIANRGDNIDLTWHITGAVSVELREQAIPGEFVQIIFANAQGQSTTRGFTVDVPCPESVRFTSHCPYVDEILGLAYQPFEHGFMVWRAPTKEVSGDTRLIYIFYDNGTYQEVSDTWQEGTFYQLLHTPPADLITPQRGFGYLYLNTPSLFETMGWATLPEVHYQGQYMIVDFVHKSADFMGYTNNIIEEFVVLPDQRVIRFHNGLWHVAP